MRLLKLIRRRMHMSWEPQLARQYHMPARRRLNQGFTVISVSAYEQPPVTALVSAYLQVMKPTEPARRRHLPTSPFKPPPAAPPAKVFAPEDRVTHDKYGLGTILEVHDGRSVLVDFGTQKVKILAPFAKLFKL
ncbi:hypothetical protein SAMN05443665_1020111 [Actinomadura meyerae]|uniref:ATP-dependent DNA helicase II n=3 Tax=Actinomadura TaxID=1988 RepID=A0A239L2F9_9ACTN|nr:hypothetical protein SAMN05443665_1020111 [Actinomadura meyerae]